MVPRYSVVRNNFTSRIEHTIMATLQCEREEQASIPHFWAVFEVTFALQLFLLKKLSPVPPL